MDEELKDTLMDDDEYVDLLIEGLEAESDCQDVSNDDEMQILNEMGF